jgi:hypothetical protein
VRRVLLIVAVVVATAVILGARSVGSPFAGGPAATAPELPAQDGARAAPTGVRCPGGADGCREVLGRIILVERVDPDGDGDLHVVIAAGGITAPGATAVDVRPGLRPRRDPRIGNLASAAGPVQRGSFGQSQIHALRFRVHR